MAGEAVIKDLERFLNKDGTISARKVRGSIGSRRNRKEGSKTCRKPGSHKPLKPYSRTLIKLRRLEVEQAVRSAQLAESVAAT